MSKNNFIIEVPIINKGTNPTPQEPATSGSAGIDLRYNGEDRVLKPLERGLFDTGLQVALPEECVGLVCPRSGLALKQGISVCNTPGIIDRDYRNNVGIILINLSNEEVTIHKGDRIAQLVIVRYCKPLFQEVETLDETERGLGGFGHTGVK